MAASGVAADDDPPVVDEVVDLPEGGQRVLGEDDAAEGGAGEFVQCLLPGHGLELPVTLGHIPPVVVAWRHL
jgi:hypothetical protein